MGMYLLLMATETISLLCLARHGSARELAGLGLGNLVYNCAALAVGFGFTGSQDTLVTQAFGSNRLELCELYLHRCQVWMCGLFLFSGTFIAFTEPLLLLVGACDRETAEHAGNYTRLMVAGLLGTFQYSALRKFLTAQKLARPGMWVQAISLPLHYLWCTLLVPRYRMRGVGVAMALKGWIDFVLLGLYASWLSPLSSCRHWWRVWKAFKGDRVWPGLLEYFYLAVPCVAMQAVEWWAFELIGLFAGYFHSPEKLAAHVAACNVSNILYLAGTGAQKATAALEGGRLGQRRDRGQQVIAGAFAPKNLQVQEILVSLLPLLAIQSMLDGMNQVIQGALQGFGLQAKASRVSIFCYWVVMLPASGVLGFPLRLGVPGLWLGCIVSGCVALLLNTLLYRRSNFEEIASAARLRMQLDCES
ncbi:Protein DETOXIFICATION 37 (AtDTX37) (Multidrug and toxic compound extrusion protein 37) (MATE protein 37) [Durusdinium trenchii]|uniref:Protein DETOXIFICATION 37 (AtDTX37) (Multidrug and toxic compound extrusion protein 37) (MATE protein 37) n=1 Tax=Durusdinium trenchii TaxID=1381693 RepID=A0ABP0SMB8_9DINO